MMKKPLGRLLSTLVFFFGSELIDERTDSPVARAIIVPWRGKIRLLGYEGLDQVVPVFLPRPSMRSRNWEIGFRTHPPLDFPPERSAFQPQVANSGICYLLLAHSPPQDTHRLIERWRSYVQPGSILMLCYGGSKEHFAHIQHEPKVFIADPRLRTRDHQKEKQSYSAIFTQAARYVRAHPKLSYVYLAEYDHWPLVLDLGQRLIERLKSEQADVLGHQVARRDQTGCVYYQHHVHDERFLPWIHHISKRSDPGVVINMFGSGSFWTRDAFLAVADVGEPVPIYLETYLPTVAHHLGFRVRDFADQSAYISALGDRYAELDRARNAGAWTLHPVKTWPS